MNICEWMPTIATHYILWPNTYFSEGIQEPDQWQIWNYTDMKLHRWFTVVYYVLLEFIRIFFSTLIFRGREPDVNGRYSRNWSILPLISLQAQLMSQKSFAPFDICSARIEQICTIQWTQPNVWRMIVNWCRFCLTNANFEIIRIRVKCPNLNHLTKCRSEYSSRTFSITLPVGAGKWK